MSKQKEIEEIDAEIKVLQETKEIFEKMEEHNQKRNREIEEGKYERYVPTIRPKTAHYIGW